MTGKPREENGPTPVSIFGRTYYLRGEGDPGYLDDLAGLVDSKMREVAQATGTADTLKVAILAALNIADDCLQGRQGRSSVNAEDQEGLVRLVAVLDEALAG